LLPDCLLIGKSARSQCFGTGLNAGKSERQPSIDPCPAPLSCTENSRPVKIPASTDHDHGQVMSNKVCSPQIPGPLAGRSACYAATPTMVLKGIGVAIDLPQAGAARVISSNRKMLRSFSNIVGSNWTAAALNFSEVIFYSRSAKTTLQPVAKLTARYGFESLKARDIATVSDRCGRPATIPSALPCRDPAHRRDWQPAARAQDAAQR
jgi:hypothetical protein